VSECAFCLQETDGEFCGPPCRASWSLLFESPEDRVPTDADVYDDDEPLTLRP
jgi:hypothetical protein